MPERDDEIEPGCMKGSFGILFRDFWVLQFEGIFEAFTFEMCENLLSRRVPRRFGGVR